uniref:UHRF1-binding protein 1-like n=1 Tax=Timema cristinae TaxID=61476 RepID=A0A7R9CT97_TIMCR|nr:unnamed protein product [Timema cristinae]
MVATDRDNLEKRNQNIECKRDKENGGHENEVSEQHLSCYKNKFSCRSRAWLDAPLDPTSSPKVRLRMTHIVSPGEIVDRNSYKDWCKDDVVIRLNDIDLELNMSTIVGLTDLVEDEIIQAPLPMQIFLENLKVRLNEDRPSSNITSPGPVPVDASLVNLKINRERDGIFHVEPLLSPGGDACVEGDSCVGVDSSGRGDADVRRDMALLERRVHQMSQENSELKRQLTVLSRVSEQNEVLRRSAEESQILRSCLSTAQDEVAALLEEKRALIDRVRSLQDRVEQLQRTSAGWYSTPWTSWPRAVSWSLLKKLQPPHPKDLDDPDQAGDTGRRELTLPPPPYIGMSDTRDSCLPPIQGGNRRYSLLPLKLAPELTTQPVWPRPADQEPQGLRPKSPEPHQSANAITCRRLNSLTHGVQPISGTMARAILRRGLSAQPCALLIWGIPGAGPHPSSCSCDFRGC